ncbi:glucose-1-phosphate adenylyltransferase [Acetomicrobium sp. S15 = DSM 107314]|jgi:glucose-1-phosphate adenylyltransferase|uniref:glucose-1-phosphate adenylyltransferase n=1 Tax=Acetomicrobium sp. S15 = DSM 107314 TaxID=2529858 RepID=UPI0018E19A8C|nr:glucose-1-phosphate adenylyltransferase [Acetomicrobium sp. S15 = DSM 107314]
MIYDKYGRVLGIVLAGGKGERLYPLTLYRAKPAVPFAAKYRIIDFALSNLVNSGLYSIYILVQFKSQSLNEHVERGWQFGAALRGRDFFVTVVPAQMWTGEHWYKGTADAVFQNLHLVTLYDADRICIFAADHVYKMDVEQMLNFHIESGADMTVAANVVPSSEAHQFGCIDADEDGRVIGFVEKPSDPPEIPDRPGYVYASMGNYIFEREVLEEALIADASNSNSSHDFGRNILPDLYKHCRVMAYDFSTNKIPGADRPYWRDVGTIKAYWEAHMDLLQADAPLNLFNQHWPVRTVSYSDPPGFTYPVLGQNCSVIGALRAEGSRVLGATVHRSVLSRNCVINPGAVLEDCIIGSNVMIGEGCKLRRVIVDSNNVIPPNTVIGYDPKADRERYYFDEDSGIVVIPMPPLKLRKDLKLPKSISIEIP